MWRGTRTLAAGALVAAVTATSACGSGCDEDLVKRASAFIAAHLSCERSEDCFAVPDFCGELPGGNCGGDLTMNRAGVMSEEWRTLSAELVDCAPDSCSVCLAEFVPGCHDGRCTIGP